MVDSIWPDRNGSQSPLPPPNVVVAKSGTTMHQLSPEAIKGILVNPTTPASALSLGWWTTEPGSEAASS